MVHCEVEKACMEKAAVVQDESAGTTEGCPWERHSDDPSIWCGCRHPDFWRCSPGGEGWQPIGDAVDAARARGGWRGPRPGQSERMKRLWALARRAEGLHA